MPTSGGLYYASAELAPPGYGPLAAWITGWSNWLAQVTGAPSVDYALSAMILAAFSISNPSYVPQNYQVWLLTTLIMIIHGCISSMPTKWIATYNSYGSTFNIIALFITIIIIPAQTNRESQGLPRFSPSSEVWGNIYDGTNFPPGLAVLMSFVAVIWTMSGYDAPFHLSEECSNANIASPRAIVLTSGVGGIMGWALQLVIAYTVTDIPAVLDADQPWAGYCFQVLSEKAANAVIAMTICCAFMMGQGCMVAACIFLPQYLLLTSSPSYLCIRTRWLFPTFAILVTSQYDYQNTCECCMVQCPRRRGPPFTHFCRRSS